VEIDLLRGSDAAYSIITMQPVRDYRPMYKSLKRQLYIWLAGSLVFMVV
jgi:two-component system sensor histidine kinase PhoQ